MLNFKVIGAGAAGNKAAIALAKSEFNINDITLINSTIKDIPQEYKNNAIIFGSTSNTLGGCGKERDIGKKLFLQDLKSGKINIDNIADPTTNAVIIVSSTEGGTGSAVTPILAKYIKEVIGVPVIVCLFFGFNTDVRGMQNSIEICQDLSDNYGVIGISNAKFINAENQNRIKAEKLANNEFINIVNTLRGLSIVPSSQNIDDTDLYKIIATPGYMKVECANISKIKNTAQFNDSISAAIDESILVDISDKGAKRIGVIFDINSSIEDYVDYLALTIQNEYGIPYEMFTHVQHSSETSTVTWIVSGLPLPSKEIEEIYENYLKSTTSVNKSKDSFFDVISEMRGNQEDAMFNMLSDTEKKNNISKAKSSFFSDFEPNKKNNSSNEY